jgi:hypothetical protein
VKAEYAEIVYLTRSASGRIIASNAFPLTQTKTRQRARSPSTYSTGIGEGWACVRDLTAWPYVVGLFVTLILGGFAVLTVDHPNKGRVAKGFFALAAIIWAGRTIMWGVSTSHTFTFRFVVCFLCFGTLGVGLVEGFRFASHEKEPTEKRTESTQPLARPISQPSSSPPPSPLPSPSTGQRGQKKMSTAERRKQIDRALRSKEPE